ncbi:MAG: caspase family protein [Acidobacteriota bacterium]
MRWLVLLLSCWTAVASAEPRRVAVVVGSNRGAADQAPLHYAEADAGKLARVLVALGHVAPDDLFLVEGGTAGAVTDALAQARRRIGGGHATLVFYFAGRVDGDALELAGERLALADMRGQLAASGADTRVVIVDGCQPVAPRSAPLARAFDLHYAADGADVSVISIASDPLALESPEIGGSLFTHHLVSALRGAADASGDGEVTIAEAYRYAYEHLMDAHADVPAQGDVALTELGMPAAALELPPGFDRVLVYAHARGQVIAELAADAPHVLAVEPGRYELRAWRGGQVVGGRVRVADHEHRIVRWDELSVHDPVARRGTGVAEAAPLAPAPRPEMLVAGGASAGVAGGVGAMPAMRAEVALPGGLGLAVTASSKRDGDGFRETSTAALVGYRLGLARGGWAAWGGAEAGGGLVMQTPLVGPVAYTGAALAGPCAGIARRLSGEISLALEAAFPVAVLHREGALQAIALPAAWLGARFAL